MQYRRSEDRIVVELDSEDATDRLGRALAMDAEPNTVIGLIGGLGVGKTRLTKGFAQAMGVDPVGVTSPTFVLIHEYQGRLPIYHFDAYRLDGPDDFEALGASEYFESGGVCVIEWADLVIDRLPEDVRIIRIVATGVNERVATIEGRGLNRLAAILDEVPPRDGPASIVSAPQGATPWD